LFLFWSSWRIVSVLVKLKIIFILVKLENCLCFGQIGELFMFWSNWRIVFVLVKLENYFYFGQVGELFLFWSSWRIVSVLVKLENCFCFGQVGELFLNMDKRVDIPHLRPPSLSRGEKKHLIHATTHLREKSLEPFF